MTTKYLCKFRFLEVVYTIELPENRGIGDLKEGFWVNADLEWCVASKVKYWIPLSCILLVTKVEEEDIRCPECKSPNVIDHGEFGHPLGCDTKCKNCGHLWNRD